MDCIHIVLLSKALRILPDIHPFMDAFTHQRRCQPRKATASRSGAVKVRRRLAQGHLLLHTQRGGGATLATVRLLANPLYLLRHCLLRYSCRGYRTVIILPVLEALGGVGDTPGLRLTVKCP